MNVGLGTASFGTSISEVQAIEVLNKFVELGGKVIDTANNYAFWQGKGGESETVIGRWLKDIQREDVQIHTKLGAQPIKTEPDFIWQGLAPETINAALEESLNRMNTEYVDVLYAHIDDINTPLLDSWSAMTELVRQGRAKYLGVSNYTPERLTALVDIIKMHKLEPISYAQYRHSALIPKSDADFGIQICLSEEIIRILKSSQVPNIIAYSPLLDGVFEEGGLLPSNYKTVGNEQKLHLIRTEAKRRNVSPSAVVIYSLIKEGVIPLTMTGKCEHLVNNLKLVL